MALCVLGRPAVVDARGGVQEVRGPRQTGVLALLAAAHPRPVHPDRLIDELWDGRAVSPAALRVNVNRLRRWCAAAMGSDPIRHEAGGYRLDLGRDELTSVRYEELAASAAALRRRGRHAEALVAADRADALWRGPAYDGARDLLSVRPAHERLESLRLDTWQEAAIALVETGDLRGALRRAEAIQAADPLREAGYGLAMVALQRAGRRADAVQHFRRAVQVLHEELGVSPGRALRDLADEITQPDADHAHAGTAYLRTLERDAPRRRLDAVPTVLQEMLADPSTPPFVGRDGLLDRVAAELVHASRRTAPVVIEAPSGLGKTRLAAELARRAVDAGLSVLYGACVRSGGVGVVPIPDLVAAAAEVVDVGDEHAPLDGLLPDRFGPAPADRELDADSRRLRMFTAAESLLGAALGDRGLVIVDDLQWVEPNALRFLRHLIDRLSGARWLILMRPAERSPLLGGFLADLARHGAEFLDLAPLGDAEVARIVDAAAPDGEVGTWRDLVVPRAGGSPFVAGALLRHLQAGGDPTMVPRGVAHVVVADIADAGPEAGALTEVMAVAGTSLPEEVLCQAAGLAGETAGRVHRELERRGLADRAPVVIEVGTGSQAEGWRLSHDLVQDAVVARLDDRRRAECHRAIGRALADQSCCPVEALRHLLRAGPEVAAQELDPTAAAALRRLAHQTSFETARDLGEAYLARSGDEARTLDGISARVNLATCLLAAGETTRGLALHAELLPVVRASDDARLLADLLLARGPVDLGGTDPLAHVSDARFLLDVLPADDRARRVQLACWAAHNLFVVGRPVDGRDLLAMARRELEAGRALEDADVSPALASLVAGIAYQATTSVDSSPAEADRAFAELHRLAEQGLIAARATRNLFALDQAMRNGTVDDLRAAVDDLAVAAVEFPRPDVRWWAAASEAAHALAGGELDRAEREVQSALRVGEEHSVALARPVSMLQRMVVQRERGGLGALHPLVAAGVGPEATPAEVAAAALICHQAGDLRGAEQAGRRLAEAPDFLVTAGPMWPVLASVAATVAHATGLAGLGATVHAAALPYEGTGLSFSGLVHFGPCDAVLARTAAAQDDLGAAIGWAGRALEQAEERGLTLFVADAAHLVADLCDRRGDPDDAARAARCRARAEQVVAPSLSR